MNSKSKQKKREGGKNGGWKAWVTYRQPWPDWRCRGMGRGKLTGCLSQIGDDLPALHSSVVILVNKEGFDNHQDLMDERSHQVIKFVQDPVNNLHQQMTLLKN